MNVWSISASISVTSADIVTKFGTEFKYHTIWTRRNGQIHIIWKSKMAMAAILNFGKMSITPDWIKIYAPNFIAKCITAMRRWSSLQCSAYMAVFHLHWLDLLLKASFPKAIRLLTSWQLLQSSVTNFRGNKIVSLFPDYVHWLIFIVLPSTVYILMILVFFVLILILYFSDVSWSASIITCNPLTVCDIIVWSTANRIAGISTPPTLTPSCVIFCVHTCTYVPVFMCFCLMSYVFMCYSCLVFMGLVAWIKTDDDDDILQYFVDDILDAEMTTWPKVETGSWFAWRHQMNAWSIRASISVTIYCVQKKTSTFVYLHNS